MTDPVFVTLIVVDSRYRYGRFPIHCWISYNLLIVTGGIDTSVTGVVDCFVHL